MVVKSFERGVGQLLPYESKYRKLVIEWSPRHLNALLLNTLSHSVEGAERFEGTLADEDDWIAVHQQSRLLQLNDLPVWLWAGTHRVTAVPGELFDAESSAAFIEVQNGALRNVRNQSDLVQAHPLVLAWQMPEQVSVFFQEHFAVVTMRHVFSAMLAKKEDGHVLKMVSTPDFVFITLTSQQQLLHMAPYSAHSGSNLAYHVLHLLRHYDLSPAMVTVLLSGCTQDAGWYHGFSGFFPHASNMPWPPNAGEGYSTYFTHMIDSLL